MLVTFFSCNQLATYTKKCLSGNENFVGSLNNQLQICNIMYISFYKIFIRDIYSFSNNVEIEQVMKNLQWLGR